MTLPESLVTVSIVIPAYNAAKYIGEALDSVFAQTFRNFEVIVINDGSPDTDRLEQVLAPYLARIVYLRQENRGPGVARNSGIRHARGEFLAFLDGDDAWEPTYLEAQLTMLRERPSLDLVYCDTRWFGDSQRDGKSFMELYPQASEVTFEALVPHQCGILTSCVVARKRAVVEAGYFGERFLRAEDQDLWLRMAYRGGRIAYQNGVLVRRRVHATSLTMDNTRMDEDEVGVLKNLLTDLKLNKAQSMLVEEHIRRLETEIFITRGKQFILAGEYGKAADYLERSLNLLKRTRGEPTGTPFLKGLLRQWMRKGKLLLGITSIRHFPPAILAAFRRMVARRGIR